MTTASGGRERAIVRPPRLARLLLGLLAPSGLRDALAAEALAAFHLDLRHRGRARARRRYWREALSPSLLRLRWQLARDSRDTPRRPTSLHPRRGRIARPGVRHMFDALLLDLRFAVRAALARPAFTAIAVGILAVGIAATTTIYTFVDHVLLRGLPYDDATRLVYFDEGHFSAPLFRAWEEVDAFEHVGAVWTLPLDLLGDGDPVRLSVGLVTEHFFEMFDGGVAAGRLLAPDDFGSAPVVVLSHAAWLQRWGGDPAVIGTILQLGGEPVQVVGILSREFRAPEALVGRAPDVWMPYDRNRPGYDEPGMYMLAAAGVLESDVSRHEAQAELDALAVRLAERDPENYREPDGGIVRFPLLSLHEATVGGVQRTLWMLLGAAGLMLLLSCSNVANLLLARGTDRGREIALRSAIGAGHARLATQLLTESVLLSACAGVIGLAAAALGTRVLLGLLDNLPRADTVMVDARVATAALALSALTGILFGVLPALQALRTDLSASLQESGRSSSESGDRLRARGALVVAEIALALVLAIGAGLIVNSFTRLNRVPLGFEPDGTQVIELDLQRVSVETRPRFVGDIAARVRTLPGVRAAGAAVTTPFQIVGGGRCCWFDRVRAEIDGTFAEEAQAMVVNPVTPGYFAALGATLRSGRMIDESDDANRPGAVLTVSAARRLFGDIDVVGKRIDIDETFQMPIVGVVEDIRHWGLNEPADQDLYVPFAAFHEWLRSVHLVVRTDRGDAGFVADLRAAVWAEAPDLPLDAVVAMEGQVARSLERSRFLAVLMGGFAVLGLFVASAGIYGSLLYAVGRRSKEIGIRLALGARPGEVVGLIVRQAAVQVGAGLTVGLAAAVVFARVLEGMLFEVTTTDVATYAVVVAVLGTVALIACWVPATRAARTDPVSTLRAD